MIPDNVLNWQRFFRDVSLKRSAVRLPAPLFLRIFFLLVRRGGFLFLLLFLFLPFLPLKSQVIDELTIKTGDVSGCGADSSDFFAQSFITDVWKVTRIGVWLRKDQPNSFVRISLVGDRGGLPAVDSVLFESPYVNPSDSGQLYVYSGLNEFVMKDQKYWILVDGYLNPATTGYASVGISSTYTDSFDPLQISEDGGISWTPVAATPMAVFVEGDTCTFPVSLFNGGTSLCASATPVTLDAGIGYAIYDWSTGDTTPAVQVSTSGTYYCTVVDSLGCVGQDTVTLFIHPDPDAGLPDTTFGCDGLAATLAVADTFALYEWNTGSESSFAAATDSGFYWVTVTDSLGCFSTDTTHLVWRPVVRPLLGNDTTVCNGEVVFFTGPDSCLSYSWSTGDSIQNIIVTASRSVWLQVIDQYGCIANSDTVQVTVNPLPPVPVILQTDSLLSTAFFAGYSYAWSFNGFIWPGADSSSFVPDTNGAVTVIISDAIGCSSESLVYLYVWNGDTLITDGFIPSGFSPNGDGVNDIFYIPDAAGGLQFSLTVVNRWGETVYHSAQYANDWGGASRSGNQLPSGNYFYNIEYSDGKLPRQGIVLLNR